jgi:peptidoglycan-associated lipoprotein
MTSVHSHSQCETIRYFSLEDTIFVEGSVYYFNVFYDLDGPRLSNQKEIYEIREFLKMHNNLTIQIGSHTDFRPIPMTNDTLSKRRAIAIVNYLVEEGISRERLSAKGFGEKCPRYLEKDYLVKYGKNEYVFTKGTILTKEYIESLPDNNTREAAHSLNRRAEIKILKIYER